jgi:hypothetical protein
MSEKEGTLRMMASGRWAIYRPSRLPVEIMSGDLFRIEVAGAKEKARQMATHASTRTTQLYDRREDRVTLDEVVKINILRFARAF